MKFYELKKVSIYSFADIRDLAESFSSLKSLSRLLLLILIIATTINNNN